MYICILKRFLFQTSVRFLFPLTFVMFYRFTNFKSSDPFLFLFAFHHFELISVHFLNQEITKYIRKIVMKNYWFLVCLHCWVSTVRTEQLTAVLIRTKSWADCYSTSCFKNFDYEVARFCFQTLRWTPCLFLFFNLFWSIS